MAHVGVGGKTFFNEPLNTENYYNWKFRIQLILAENGVAECIEREVNIAQLTGEEKAKEIKNENKAKSLIVQCVKDNQLESLREKKTISSMWKLLEQKYEKNDLPGQLYLKKKMLSMKLNEGEDLNKFLDRVDEVVRQLKSTGVEIQESDVICNMLLTLPKSYETVATIIENKPADTLNNEEVKNKLLAEEEKRKHNSRQGIVTDQTAFGVEVICYGCGKKSHIKRNFRVTSHRSFERNLGYSNIQRGGCQQFRSKGFNRGFNRGSRGEGRYQRYEVIKEK
ncbi:unnamed protein product [Psylliodes chrysocephalus]|uniref:Copia protein n=1 Tax=Psylliodes chrysocephalus TaxID=3402493 RepID=A0A9P0GIN5_9CUCU|nr:unnamed protein product [Psylliodes chrysocephala]